MRAIYVQAKIVMPAMINAIISVCFLAVKV